MPVKITKPSFHLTYREYIGAQPSCIEGKPLGFIDRLQFCNLYKDPLRFVRKLLSCSPKDMLDIADSGAMVKNHRFVFSTTGPKFERQIFVSPELSRVAAVSYAGREVLDLELVDVYNKILFLECRM